MRSDYIIATMMAMIVLLALPLVAAEIDVFQNSHFINASESMDPGPKGLGGILSSINQSIAADVTVQVSGTWLQKFDAIIVDALVIRANSPVSGANCSLNLKNSLFAQVVTSAPMPEHTITGEPHYTYNATNITSISPAAEEGKFFGHVTCIKTPPGAFTVYTEADFEVHELRVSANVSVDNAAVINQILALQTTLIGLLDRQFDFTQEEVFLVTDSFTSMSRILDAVKGGSMTETEAKVKVSEIEQSLQTKLGAKYNEAKLTLTSKSGLFSRVTSSITATPRQFFNDSPTKVLAKLFFIFALIYGAVAVYEERKERVSF